MRKKYELFSALSTIMIKLPALWQLQRKRIFFSSKAMPTGNHRGLINFQPTLNRSFFAVLLFLSNRGSSLQLLHSHFYSEARRASLSSFYWLLCCVRVFMNVCRENKINLYKRAFLFMVTRRGLEEPRCLDDGGYFFAK